MDSEVISFPGMCQGRTAYDERCKLPAVCHEPSGDSYCGTHVPFRLQMLFDDVRLHLEGKPERGTGIRFVSATLFERLQPYVGMEDLTLEDHLRIAELGGIRTMINKLTKNS